MAAMEPQVFVIEFERKNPENRFHGEDKTIAAGFNVRFLLHHAPKNASKHKNLQHQGTTWSSKEENAFGFLRDAKFATPRHHMEFERRKRFQVFA